MTRKKKSRKVGANGTFRLSKEQLLQLRAQREQRRKKVNGKRPGNRNSELLKKSESTSLRPHKDKRVGSKKAIPLVATDTPKLKVQDEVNFRRDLSPQVSLKAKITEPSQLSPEQELAQLEQNPKFISSLNNQKIQALSCYTRK